MYTIKRLTMTKVSKGEEDKAEVSGSESMSTGKFVTALELKHGCQQHQKKFCFVKRDGEHRYLTQAEIAQWALMIVSVFIFNIDLRVLNFPRTSNKRISTNPHLD